MRGEKDTSPKLSSPLYSVAGLDWRSNKEEGSIPFRQQRHFMTQNLRCLQQWINRNGNDIFSIQAAKPFDRTHELPLNNTYAR